MRTNYKRIQNILNKMGLATIRLRDGSISAQYGPEADDAYVRVVLVDHNSIMDVGIHCRQLDSESLEARLQDAIEVAMKDNYPTVWLHQSPKPSEETRQRLIKGLTNWIENKKQRATDNHAIATSAVNVEKIISEMTEDQLRAVMAISASVYNKGYWDCHEFNKTLEASKTEVSHA